MKSTAVKNFGDLMETLFDARFGPVFRDEPAQARIHPPVNISEGEGSFYIEVMAPGVPKEEIKIQILENVLTITYDKKEPAAQSSEKVLRTEFAVKSFKRSFTLGETVDAERIDASYEHGLLKIELPKKEKVKPAQIEIKVK
jgi:HSP20 family protein